MVSTRVPWAGRSLGQLLLVVVMLGYVTTSGIQRYQMVSTNATAWEGDYQFLDEEHQEVMDHVDEAVNKIRAKIGTLWSKNSALLHRMRKLDEYIKRGTDMETRYVIEIIGYPWDQDTISPGVFLENLAFSMGISNFSQSQVTGLRIMAGMKYSDARVIVEFPSSKIKRLWLKGYKKKLYEVSWGRNAEAVFGSKETYKTFVHKTVYLQDFLPTLCEMHPVGAVPFAINDYISPYRKRLLSYAKLLAKHYQYRFVWVSEGDIFVRKKDGEPGFYIRSERDFRCFDWRLESEQYFWKIINECNVKRRNFLRLTTRRILPWMTRGDPDDSPLNPITENLLIYKRKFDDHLENLLQQVKKKNWTAVDVFDVTYKYRFHKLNIVMNRTNNRNSDLMKNWNNP